MKLTISHLIILLFTILLAFQPLQVSAITRDSDQLTYNPPTNFYVRLWHLTQSGAKAIPETQCASGHDSYGCVAYSGLGYYYPYNTNPALVSVENDYLLDVVPRELDPRVYHSVAEAAEAVAARSYAYYWNFKGFNLGNDSNYQVFVPYTFEQWLGFMPNNSSIPCKSTNLNQAQQIVCNAVGPRHYISYYGNEPAQAEFTSDVYNVTVTDTGPEYSPYIHSVQDPISTACDANDFGPLMGMSPAIPNLKKVGRGEGICGKVAGKISSLEGSNDQTTDFAEHHSWFSRSLGSSPRHTQTQPQHSIRGN